MESTRTEQTVDRFESPESSLVVGAEYYMPTNILYVTLKVKGGTKTFGYMGVSLKLWQGFKNAASKGAFFGEEIRRNFVGKPKE